jgi:hypothetical protein
MDDEDAAELARVAALRGKKPEDYQPHMVEVRTRVPIPINLINDLWKHHPNPQEEYRAYDVLPAASRAFIRDCDVPLSPIRFLMLLEFLEGNEARVLKILAELMPLIKRSAVVSAYGKDHPEAQPLGIAPGS